MANLKYFYGSLLVTVAGLIAAFFVGHEHPLTAVYITAVLALLEISLSFDNAVINARVLAEMPMFWRKLFIYIGLPIAVFGMRLIFPILLVDMTTQLSFIDVFHLATSDPHAYHEALLKGMPMISAFGGAFLLKVFLGFFFDQDKDVHWVPFLEANRAIKAASSLPGISLLLSLIVGMVLIYYTENWQVALAYLSGIVLHELLNVMGLLFNQPTSSSQTLVRNGLISFIYLEFLDASFSFDGVIGAFAISTNIFIIMIGLGIGAMFVRSLTIFLVEKKTLSSFPYLEHGAHYAIGFLACVMFIKMFHHVPEAITGTVGIGLIILACLHSYIERRIKS
ncbi:DUF475 domain-containing protein [Piscirickettsia salmonis]|uniref:DUF475 domain-containing protein n=1 Tax=Piscirickettsia salmonis TaxID=1238 RepID=UPI003A805854